MLASLKLDVSLLHEIPCIWHDFKFGLFNIEFGLRKKNRMSSVLKLTERAKLINKVWRTASDKRSTRWDEEKQNFAILSAFNIGNNFASVFSMTNTLIFVSSRSTDNKKMKMAFHPNFVRDEWKLWTEQRIHFEANTNILTRAHHGLASLPVYNVSCH